MTRKELIVLILLSVIVLGVLICIWPTPDIDTASIEQEVLNDFLRKNRPRGDSPPMGNRRGQILEEMEKAARQLAREFPQVRDAVLDAAGKGQLEEVAPYEGELSVPGEVVVVHLLLVADGKPTCDRENGRIKLRIEGLDSPDLDRAGKEEPDYELLASVLAGMQVRRQAAVGENLAVELFPMAFVPLEDLRKAAEAAARAGITQIKLRESPIPH